METQDKKVIAKQPVGYSVGGFTVGNLATMVRSKAVGTIIALGERDGQQTVTLEFEQPQPVDAPEGATATRFELSWRNISSTWAEPSISNVQDAPANTLVEPREEESIGLLTSEQAIAEYTKLRAEGMILASDPEFQAGLGLGYSTPQSQKVADLNVAMFELRNHLYSRFGLSAEKCADDEERKVSGYNRVTVVATDGCYPIEYRTTGRMREDGILEIDYPFTNTDGTEIKANDDPERQIDFSHIIYAGGREEKIDPTRTVGATPKAASRPRTYGDDQALMVVAAYRMGLEPGLLDDAIKQLEGKRLHPITGAAISQEACRMNELLRHDATLIERAIDTARK